MSVGDDNVRAFRALQEEILSGLPEYQRRIIETVFEGTPGEPPRLVLDRPRVVAWRRRDREVAEDLLRSFLELGRP